MKLVVQCLASTTLLCLPFMAFAMPINFHDDESNGSNTPFATSFDNSDNAEAVFSNNNTGSLDFRIAPSQENNASIRYNNRFTTGGDVVSLIFGGLTQGQSVSRTFEAADNANPNGIDALRTSGNFTTADFNFDNSTYNRPTTGDYDGTAYVPAPGGGDAATPVTVDIDTVFPNGRLGVLTGHGVSAGFGTGEFLMEGFGAITLVFADGLAVSGVAGYVGSLESPNTVEAIAYNAAGEILGSTTNMNETVIDNIGDEAFELLGFETAMDDEIIRAITFQQIAPDELGFALDYVVFELAGGNTTADPIPAASSIVLMLLGLGGLARRRRRSAA